MRAGDRWTGPADDGPETMPVTDRKPIETFSISIRHSLVQSGGYFFLKKK
jgi:hypothetical protein